MRAIHRLLVCVASGVASFFLLSILHVELLTKLMISWDVFSLSMILFIWVNFFKVDVSKMRREAQIQDESRIVIFIIVLASVMISLLGILIMLNYADNVSSNKFLHFPVSILGVALSWFLLHSVFTVRYAHVYYGNNIHKPLEHCGGIDFPLDNKPEFLDFAYFSFIIGMTFQVADTNITSKHIRRLVLMHAMLSFAFNTVIVALSIGIISGLKK